MNRRTTTNEGCTEQEVEGAGFGERATAVGKSTSESPELNGEIEGTKRESWLGLADRQLAGRTAGVFSLVDNYDESFSGQFISKPVSPGKPIKQSQSLRLASSLQSEGIVAADQPGDSLMQPLVSSPSAELILGIEENS